MVYFNGILKEYTFTNSKRIVYSFYVHREAHIFNRKKSEKHCDGKHFKCKVKSGVYKQKSRKL